MGTCCHQEEDYGGAFEYYTKAAELGDATAHYLLSCMYHAGNTYCKTIRLAETHHPPSTSIHQS